MSHNLNYGKNDHLNSYMEISNLRSAILKLLGLAAFSMTWLLVNKQIKNNRKLQEVLAYEIW